MENNSESHGILLSRVSIVEALSYDIEDALLTNASLSLNLDNFAWLGFGYENLTSGGHQGILCPVTMWIAILY